MAWKVGANKSLPIKNQAAWDGSAAEKSVFSWAGFDGETPSPEKARQAFLIYDSENSKEKGGYKLPFGIVSGGKLYASSAGLRAAATRLPQTDAPPDVLKRARSIIDAYQTKMGGAKSKNSSNDDLTVLCLENNFSMNPDDMPDDPEDPIMCSIEMVRTGKFMRNTGYFKQLITITEDMIDNMINNFNDKVIAEDISLDINHNREQSFGWLRKVSKKVKNVKGVNQTYMVGDYEINKLGKDYIGDKVYSYYSLEFHPNYQQHEVFKTTKGPDGEEMPVGEMTMYGPTITGGALTNRPFIPNLNEGGISFSQENGENFKVESIYFETEDETSSESSENVVKGSEENKKVEIEPINKIEDKKFSFNFSNPLPEKRSNMENLKQAIKFFEEQLGKIEDKNGDQYKSFSVLLENAKKELAEFENKNIDFSKKFNEMGTQLTSLSKNYEKVLGDNEKLTTTVATLESSNKEFNSQLKLSQKRERVATVENYCKGLMSKGFPKGVVDKTKKFMMGDLSQKQCIEFSDEKGEKKSLAFDDVIAEILGEFPAECLVPLTETTRFDKDNGEGYNKDPNETFFSKNKDAIEAGKKNAFAKRKAKKINSDEDAAN